MSESKTDVTLKTFLENPKARIAATAVVVLVIVACIAGFALGGGSLKSADISDDLTPAAGASDFTITGGTAGVDYEFTNVNYQRTAHTGSNTAGNASTPMLVIKTSTPLTISNASGVSYATTGIRIAAGVDAYLTFNGVKIQADVPCDIVTNSASPGTTTKTLAGPATKLHLTLADGSNNELLANAAGHAPGLRCGEGSELYIDDSVPNVDTAGNPITPQGGFIPTGTTYVANDGKTYTVQGKNGDNALTKLDSRNPGSLKLLAGYRAAGIGGGSWENAGKMTFNGGIIESRAWTLVANNNRNTADKGGAGSDWDYGCGAGIGGGYAGGGTEMYFNGGTYDIYGSYHGAAIGGGMYAYSSTSSGADWPKRSYPFADAIRSGLQPDSTSSEKTKSVPGNITINGGYIKAKGGLHGNAFGQACGSWAKGCTILITGGTLLPDSYGTLKMIGGGQGRVVITGGSVNCTTAKFESSDNYAYGVLNDYTTTNRVFMTTIDLSADGWVNDPISDFTLYINGDRQEYGAPSRFDNGKLYLWLPTTAAGKEIRVSLSGEQTKSDGTIEEVTPADLYIPSVTTDGTSKLKRYINFEFPEEWRKQHWYKDYNGLPFEHYDFTANGPIDIPNDTNKLTSGAKVTYKYQYVDDDGELIGEEIDATNQANMPVDASKFHITITSTEYADQTGYKESYWGHRAYGDAEIRKVDSSITTLKAQWYDGSGNLIEEENHKAKANDKLLITAQITSASNTATTCKAPTGKIELVVDGKVVETFDLTPGGTNATGKVEVKTYSDGREYVQFTYEATATTHGYLLPTFQDDNKHEITMNYIAAKNYLDTMADKDPTVPKANVTVEPVEPEPAVDGEDVDVEPDPAKDKEPEAGDHTYEKGYKLTYNFKEMEPVLVTPDPTDNSGEEDGDDDDDDSDDDDSHYVIPPNKMTFEIASPSNGAFKVNSSTNTTVADAITVVQKKAADGTPVRNAKGEFIYEVSVDVASAGMALFELTQEPNGAFYGTKFLLDLTVNPNTNIDPDPELSKTAVNVTHPQGAVQAGDRIRYTITAENKEPGSVWWFPKISDTLPASVELDKESVHLSNPSEGFDEDLTEEQFTYTDGTLKVGLGVITKVFGLQSATLTFDVIVKDEVGTRDATDALKSVANVATATGHKGIEIPEDGSDPKDPDDPSVPAAQKPESEPANPDPSPSAEPLNPKVLPKDPVKAQTSIVKVAKNANRDEGLSEVGDTIEYTITLKNDTPGSCWYSAAFLDNIPVGIAFESGSAKLKLPTGTTVDLDDDVYDSARNRLGVSIGDIYGGEEAVLTFKGKVTEQAEGRDIGNIANVIGTLPSDKGGKGGTGLGDDDTTPAGDVPTEGGKPYLPDVDDITDIVTSGGLPSDPTDPTSPKTPVSNPEPVYPTPDDEEAGKRASLPDEYGGGAGDGTEYDYHPEEFDDRDFDPAIDGVDPINGIAVGPGGDGDDTDGADGASGANGTDAAGGSGSYVSGAGNGAGSSSWDSTSGSKGLADRLLAQTGDPVFWVVCGVVAVAVAAGVVALVSRSRKRKDSE